MFMSTRHIMRLWGTIASFALVANVAYAESLLSFYLAENDSCSPQEHVKSQEDCNLAAAQMRLKDMGGNGVSSFNATAYKHLIYKAGCYAHVIRDDNGDSSDYYHIEFFSGQDLAGELKGFPVCKMSEEESFLRYNQTVGSTENLQNSTMMTRLFNRTRSKRSKSKNSDATLAPKEGQHDKGIRVRGSKVDGKTKSKLGSSKSKTPKILGRYKRAKSNIDGKGSKGNVSSCKSASEKSSKSGRRPKAFYNGKKGRRSKGTKAPSQDTKAPRVSSSKDTKAPKARDSLANGKSKGNLMKNKSNGIGGYKGRKSKSAKGSSPTKGKGHQCSTESPSPEPSVFPVEDPSSIPSEFPSSAPTPTPPIILAFDTCIPGCQNNTVDATIEKKFEEIIRAYAFGTQLAPGDISLKFSASKNDCLPCNGGSRRSLEDLLLLQNEITAEIEVQDTVLVEEVDSLTVVTNMEANIDSINSDLQEIGVVVNTIEVQTSAPTAAPIPISTEPPSPPPAELSRAVLAREMNLERRRLSTALEEENEERNEKTSPEMLNDLFISENYYADLPEFVTVGTNDPFHCKCVDCNDDEVCGGLWTAKNFDNSDSRDNLQKKQIHIIISHCKNPLDWVESFTEGYEIASIHVVTKCGEDIEKIKAPSKATIEILENIGRCDHTYAYYIANILPQKVDKDREGDSIVVFLKDDISEKNFHQAGHWNTFEGLLSLASSDNGFGCGVNSDGSHVSFGPHSFLLSAYHEVKSLFEFAMESYGRNIKGYAVDESEFLSQFSTFGQWWEHLHIEEDLPELIQVCYGGVFAASTNNVYRREMSIWKTIEKSLSRGSNIQEGHYAERSWAALMSTPLQPFQIEALKEKADGVYMNKSSMHGALLTRPQLYLHIGTFGTTSTEYLADALIDYKTELKSDGYNIAVHGKFDNGAHGFPNVDRLGSCMWSDMNKRLFPEYMKEAAVCESNVLQDLSEFMDNTLKEQNDLIISNPWLVRPGTAESLAIYLNPVWDVKTVVYYRRYFEWITLLYNEWRQDLLLHLSPEAIPSSSFRYIDFLREYNKRLFYGKDVNEDGFPVRDLGSDSNHRSTIGKSRKVYLDKFDIISDSDIEELTDLQESPYYAAKQYFAVPRLRDVVVVNFHDIRGVEVNFFCNVLDDADETCKAAVDTEELLGDAGLGDESFVQNGSPFLLETAVGDIVIAAIVKNKLNFEKTKRKGKFNLQLNLWNHMVEKSLDQRNVTVQDLPSECLYSFESEKLLEVSLAYEKRMLPAFFSTRRGAKHLRKSFKRWRFCSVDTKEILESSEWDFIFENMNDFTLHNQSTKAYVHIGAPKTGSTSIQDTLAADRLYLKEDKFFVAVHGQVRPPGTEEYIIDNMLVKCDQLGACVWSEEEREIVVQGSGDEDAGKCPDYLLHEFDRFVSMAKEQKSNIVISNEWLNRKSSEDGLSKLLQDFDTTIVIYYRRFYDWMISAHYQWHFDLGTSSFQALQGKIRLVDFIRMFCQRLFALEISNLHADTALAGLTDINEYTWHAYKRYSRIPEFDENIQIVNFHDGHIIKSFYCDVLKAPKACELETKRLEEKHSTRTRSKSSTMLFDLAVGIHWSKHTEIDEKKTIEDFHKTAEKLKERLLARGLSEEDLPRECLSSSEQDLLLRVSLEYENILLPSGSFSDKGKDAMRKDFAKYSNNNRFCSVNLDIVNDPNWRFLLQQI